MHTILKGVILIRVPEWGNATLIEIIWTICGVVGVAVTAVSAYQLVHDRFNLREGIHYLSVGGTGSIDAALLIYNAHVRREVLRVVQMSLVFGLGIYSMTQNSYTNLISIVGIIITVIFFLFVLITVVQSVEDRMTRIRLFTLLRTGKEVTK